MLSEGVSVDRPESPCALTDTENEQSRVSLWSSSFKTYRLLSPCPGRLLSTPLLRRVRRFAAGPSAALRLRVTKQTTTNTLLKHALYVLLHDLHECCVQLEMTTQQHSVTAAQMHHMPQLRAEAGSG